MGWQDFRWADIFEWIGWMGEWMHGKEKSKNMYGKTGRQMDG